MVMSVIYFARIVMPPQERADEPEHVSLRQRVSSLVGPVIHNRRFMQFVGATFLVRAGIEHAGGALQHLLGAQSGCDRHRHLRSAPTAGQAALVIGYYLFGRLAARYGHRAILL